VIFSRVVNASPLIFLTKVGLLEVLREPSVPVLVPDVVLAEVGGLDSNDPAVRAVEQSQWMRVVSTPHHPRQRPRLGLGRRGVRSSGRCSSRTGRDGDSG
jgi:hypothetical protein